jgi:hypothetical protein
MLTGCSTSAATLSRAAMAALAVGAACCSCGSGVSTLHDAHRLSAELHDAHRPSHPSSSCSHVSTRTVGWIRASRCEGGPPAGTQPRSCLASTSRQPSLPLRKTHHQPGCQSSGTSRPTSLQRWSPAQSAQPRSQDHRRKPADGTDTYQYCRCVCRPAPSKKASASM